MQAFCYILFSNSLNKFYVGVTTDQISERIIKHNNAEYGNHRFTSIANDWELFLCIKSDNFPHAVRLERKIKSMKSSKYILNLKKYPELIQKIIIETRSI